MIVFNGRSNNNNNSNNNNITSIEVSNIVSTTSTENTKVIVLVVLTILETFCKPLATFCKPLETFCKPLATFCRPTTICKPELDCELQNVACIGWTRLQFVNLPLLVTIGITVLQLNEGFELVTFYFFSFYLTICRPAVTSYYSHYCTSTQRRI